MTHEQNRAPPGFYRLHALRRVARPVPLRRRVARTGRHNRLNDCDLAMTTVRGWPVMLFVGQH